MSVQEIVRNKKYRISVVLGYNGDKRTRYTETFLGGKRDAVAREAELKAKAKNNSLDLKNNMTMSELIKEWIEYKRGKIAVKTFVTYELYSKNIDKYLGHLKLINITPKVLDTFYAQLKNETTFAPKTIKHHYIIVSNLFNLAINWGYVQNNPNERVEAPKVRQKEIEYYTPDEVNLLIEVLKQESIKSQAVILLALDSGIRRGELTGLTWEDVDFKNGTIKVDKTTQYVAGYGTFEKETKTETSNRILYIAPSTLEILKKYQNEQWQKKLLLGEKWQNSKRIFTTEYGADMHPNTPSKILSSIIKKYNLKPITFHGLRHTSITLLINSGIQSQIISKRAGHSNVTTTHKTYSHFFNDEFKAVANTMDMILSQSITK